MLKNIEIINLLILSTIFFFITLISLSKFIPFSKERLLDEPDYRSSHNKAIPTGGGIIFGILGSIVTAFNGFYIPSISLPLGIIGLYDDKYKIPSNLRYLSQIFICVILFIGSPLSKNLENYQVIFLPLIIVFSTAIINFCNFIDGLDGLLASCMIISISTLSFEQPSLWPFVACLLGFIVFNWSPAKIFMGDAGSTFLGAVFVGTLMQMDNIFYFCKGLFLITPILADCITCLVRRLMARQNIFKAHKLHLYQRLHQSGWSHSKVTILYCIGVVILCLTYLKLNVYACIVFSIFEIFIGFYLDRNYAAKFIK